MAALILAERQLSSLPNPGRHEAELRMFRAGGMLVLYNAVEASARAGIEAIYDEVAIHGVTFDELRPSIRKRIIKDFKTNFAGDKGDTLTAIAAEIATAPFNVEKLFSGNVDARKIKEKALVYGFPTVTDFRLTADGADLVTVKASRNDLAHGLKSFGEIGRDYTAHSLYRLGSRVMNYLEAILIQIDVYLDDGDYIG